MKRLEGKVAIVTGGAGGIGEGIVRRLVSEGASVMIADLNLDVGQKLADEFGLAAAAVTLDVRDRGAWRIAIDETIRRFGRMDTLVNNAGVLVFKLFEEHSAEDIDLLLGVNLVGTILGCQAALPELERTGGAIINISSADGLSPANAVSVYAASKFGVTGFTRALALELGPRGIRVNSVHPSAIYTNLANFSGVSPEEYDKRFWTFPSQRTGSPADIGAMVAFLASEDGRHCYGAQFSVDGGITAGHYYFGMPGAPRQPQS